VTGFDCIQKSALVKVEDPEMELPSRRCAPAKDRDGDYSPLDNCDTSVCARGAGGAEAGERAAAVAAAGFDTGAEGEVGFGTPLRAKAIRHIAKYDRWPQSPVAFVVCRLHIATRQKKQQLVTRGQVNRIAQMTPLGIRRLTVEQRREFVREAGALADYGPIRKIGAAAADCAGII
jgi:hypothetical protein